MQTRSSDENSLCLLTKRKKVVSAFLYHMTDHLSYFCDMKNGWWGGAGGDPLYLKFRINRPPLERNRRFWTDIRSKRLSEESSINKK